MRCSAMACSQFPAQRPTVMRRLAPANPGADPMQAGAPIIAGNRAGLPDRPMQPTAQPGVHAFGRKDPDRNNVVFGVLNSSDAPLPETGRFVLRILRTLGGEPCAPSL